MANRPLITTKDSSENRLWIELGRIDPVPKIKIKFLDSDNKIVENVSQLWKDSDKNRARVFVKFIAKSVDIEFKKQEELASYLLINRSSKEAYLQNRKDAIIRHIYECDGLFIDGSKFYEVENFKGFKAGEKDKIECKIQKEPVGDNKRGKIKLLITEKSDQRVFTISEEAIEIVPTFSIPAEFDEMITFPSSPPKKKPLFWTPTKIILAVLIIGVISALIYYYRKKIWAWIKRENKSKKKEQVEIF